MNNMKSGQNWEQINKEISNWIIRENTLEDIQNMLIKISSEKWHSCAFIQSNLSKEWIEKIWNILENNLFNIFPDYVNKISNDDELWKFYLGINNKIKNYV